MNDRSPMSKSVQRVLRLGARVAWSHAIHGALGRTHGVAIGRAVQQALMPPAATEAEWFSRIEQARASLAQVSDRVELTDFGAGGSSGGSHARSEATDRVVELGPFYKLSHVDELSSRVLFSLVRALEPQAVIELGTCTGLSAAYLSAALRLNGKGKLVTIEGAPALAVRARETIATLGLSERVEVRCGSFADQLPVVCHDLGKVDLLFNDGHHLEEPTVAYFEMVLPYLADNAVVVLDDISWSRGMRRAWRRLKAHPRVATSMNLWRLGVLALGEGAP